MSIHHLNCGTLHPLGLPRRDGKGGIFRRGYGVLHCLLVETGAGLALVDTGWGTHDCANPSWPVRFFMDFIGGARDPEESAVRQVARLGFDPADVSDIFLTHLHLDHAGGLPDFPAATVHLSEPELAAVRDPRDAMERFAYRPEHFAHGPRWKAHPFSGGVWFGLDSSPPARIGEAEFVFLPLPGHTRGHSAVAVRAGGRWVMHCGDSYIYHRQAGPDQPYRHPSGSLLEHVITAGFRIPRRHWVTLRRLFQSHPEEIFHFCAHDAHEFNLVGR
jgi:glyoxylase-like metal-dependent hydrolase (beta-lactamase superfamily II)